MPEIGKQKSFKNREEWRAWLAKNHAIEKELWLVLYKKNSNKPTVSYDEAVEEACCFGWIDGIIKAIDDEKYVTRFSPRKMTVSGQKRTRNASRGWLNKDA